MYTYIHSWRDVKPHISSYISHGHNANIFFTNYYNIYCGYSVSLETVVYNVNL